MSELPQLDQPHFVHLDEIDSTNKYALRNFDKLHNMTFITAAMQNKGQGRRGRSWLSPPNINLYASLLIKDFPFPVSHASWLGSLAPLAALRDISPDINPWLKWPNDIYCKNRKISGNLCEIKTDSHNQFQGVVIGIGLNLNMTKEELDKIDQPATSLLAETGITIDINFFAKKVANLLFRLYSMALSSGTEELYEVWKKENILVGQQVNVLFDNGKQKNLLIKDLGTQGEMIAECEGELLTLYSGDIRLKVSSDNGFQ